MVEGLSGLSDEHEVEVNFAGEVIKNAFACLSVESTLEHERDIGKSASLHLQNRELLLERFLSFGDVEVERDDSSEVVERNLSHHHRVVRDHTSHQYSLYCSRDYAWFVLSGLGLENSLQANSLAGSDDLLVHQTLVHYGGSYSREESSNVEKRRVVEHLESLELRSLLGEVRHHSLESEVLNDLDFPETREELHLKHKVRHFKRGEQRQGRIGVSLFGADLKVDWVFSVFSGVAQRKNKQIDVDEQEVLDLQINDVVEEESLLQKRLEGVDLKEKPSSFLDSVGRRFQKSKPDLLSSLAGNIREVRVIRVQELRRQIVEV